MCSIGCGVLTKFLQMLHHFAPSLRAGYFACGLYCSLLPASLIDFGWNVLEQFNSNCLVICCPSYEFVVFCCFSDRYHVLEKRLFRWFAVWGSQRDYLLICLIDWFSFPNGAAITSKLILLLMRNPNGAAITSKLILPLLIRCLKIDLGRTSKCYRLVLF